MVNPFLIDEGITLLQAIEKIQTPANFLTSQFFNETVMSPNNTVALETRKAGRLLAPAIVKNAKGVNVDRTTATAKWYSPFTFAPRRVIGLEDVSRRIFGEVPNLYGSLTPEQRAARMQAEDLADLLKLHENRREQMAAELLQTGKLSMKAYADDGELAQLDTIEYGVPGIKKLTGTKIWSNAAADIYGDLLSASEQIQKDTGVIPTIAICGKNIERYLIKNTEILNWLMIPNRQNLAMASLEPRFTSPETRFIGRIGALNLDLYSYAKTYLDENLQAVPFIGDNTIIIAAPNIGSTVYCPVTIFSKEQSFQTVLSQYVPKYTINEESETLSLTIYSKCLIVPRDVESWITLTVA